MHAYIPAEYGISQVYPNPFNPATNITVGVAQDGYASVVIYNANGQLVETVHSGNLSKGSHSFTWNAGYQSSGIYFARVNINGDVSSAKLMLIK